MAGAQPFDPSADAADRLAILQVEADYARTWDSRDAAAWAALFTEDGAFELAGFAGDPSHRFEGRAEGWRMRLRREQPVVVDDRFGDFPTAERMWDPDLA